MFVIPRKEGESIVIGDEIVVTVIEVQGEQVRLTVERLPDGTDAPAEVTELVLQGMSSRKVPR